MKHRIITISREFGSGGRTIGRKIAEQLGIPCYDEELITRLVEESGYSEEFIKNAGEYSMQKNWFASALSINSYHPLSPQDQIWIAEKKIIEEIGSNEDCVILGRCADYILEDIADCLHVFIHADFDKRAERVIHSYGETDVKIEQRLKDKDKRRATFYQFYTDRKWDDLKNYDLVLNSGTLGIDKCVEIIKNLY